MSASSSSTGSTPAGSALVGPVLVIGGAGYIGSHTVAELVRCGVPTIIYDNLSTGHLGAARATLVVGDMGNREQLARAFREHRPRSVIHFAAKCFVGESVVDPAKYYLENVVYTHTLLEVMREHNVQEIVFSSTCATYGEPVRIPIDESHPQVPISPYGKTKLHIEHMLEDYTRAYGLRAAALRYFNAAGASQDGTLGEDHQPETHLIPLVLQVALGQRPEILIFGDDYPTPDGTCIRDYVHVEDLARAHLSALARLQAGVSSIRCNLGTGSGYSVREVIEAARRISAHPIPARVVARREGDPPSLVSGGTRARDLLGWQPQRGDLEDILRDAWRFHSTKRNGMRG